MNPSLFERLGIAPDLRAGRPVRDEDFDRAYPEAIRSASARYWTPVHVATRAAELLVGREPSARVLDVGAGIGKFCAIGALTTGATFTGVEHRRHLVDLGQSALEGTPRAHLVCGTLEDVAWHEFDGYYFFNPFEENLYHPSECFDQSVPLDAARFSRDIALAEVALDLAPVGMRVVTYHGFGGRMPITYRLMHAEAHGVGVLRHWVKTAQGRSLLHEGQLEMLCEIPRQARILGLCRRSDEQRRADDGE